ncbi:MAG: hypothetical protein ACI9JM_000578 [Halioglobus sp.]
MPKLLRILCITYLIYVAISLLIVTPLLNYLPHKFMADTYARELQTKWLWFNPFTVSLEIREAALPDHDGEKFVALGEASINLSLSSVYRQGWIFDQIQVLDLYVHARQLDEEHFNFSDLLESEAETPEPAEEESEFPGLTVHDLDLQAQSLIFSDQSRDTPFTSHFTNLKIQALDFSTVIEEGRPYSIELSGEKGGRLSWQGNISIPKARSDGHLVLDNVSLIAPGRFAEPFVKFELAQGRLHVDGSYDIQWGDALRYKITDAKVALSGLDLISPEDSEHKGTRLQLETLEVSNLDVDSELAHATIEGVAVAGLEIVAWSEGSRVSLLELFAPVESAAANVQQSSEEAEQAEENESESWTASLSQFQLSESKIHWRSELADPPDMLIDSITASAGNINWPLEGTSPLALSLRLNEKAKMIIDGELDLDEGNGHFNYSLEEGLLSWLNPALPSALKAKLTSGELSLNGLATLTEFAPVTIELDTTISDFGIRQQDSEEIFAGWNSLRFKTLAINMQEQHLTLEKLAIDGLTGRVHIAEDGSLNTADLWREEATAQEASAAPSETKQAADAETETVEPSTPWTIEVPTIVIRDSAIDFEDKSLPVPFRTVVGDLNGEILGLSSRPRDTAKVDIKGSVDSYAPVALKGEFNPLKTPASMDLALTFDGVDLARVTPYSGTYAGYAINRGLLTMDLQYTLDDNHLVGANNLVIDQLKLGDKVDSDQAADIPLALALSLLTDTNGVIDMKLPVKGDVNDPSFQLSSVIAGAFFNLITKAVTAPFSLLANLVNTKDDLQHLAFAVGSDQLDDANRAKLEQLGAALAQRPKLSVVLNGRVRPNADSEKMQKDALKQQLVDKGLSQESLLAKDDDWEEAITKRYKALNAQQRGDTEAETAQQQYVAVIQSVELADDRLLQLAEARAVAVKNYMIEEAGIAPERAVIEPAVIDEDDKPFSGVELVLGK